MIRIGTDIVGENQGQVGREKCVKTKGEGYLEINKKNDY
jgi:hypothetical protein